MKIESSINANLVNFKNDSVKKSADPFDLNLETTSLTNNHNEAPVTSVSLCTPGCGMTGTGNSFCC